MPGTYSHIEHAVLRVLASMECTAIRVHQAIRATWPTSTRADVMHVLARLEAQGLVDRNDNHQWRTTPRGQDTALGLGPATGLLPIHDSAQLTAHQLLARDTPSRPRSSLGTGDMRPPVMRPGADVAARLPSRMGAWRRWPDGRVTPCDTHSPTENPQ